ncbi:MAG: TAXI family TRAP transporter solute-binding subunit [Nitratireductor sp.]
MKPLQKPTGYRGTAMAIMGAALILLASILSLATPGEAAEFEKNIVTGGAKGTYIQIGKDLAEIEAQCGLTLNVQESAGSLENLVAVKNRLFTQFGIVQSDVLDYVRSYSANDAELSRSLWGVRIMFPLYNEEIHVLAKRDINSLADLKGRKVAIGAADSGTYLTATLVLDIMRVRNAERLAISSADALPKLMSGEIDALFYVAGAPAALFSDVRIDGSQLHLLDLSEPQLRAAYLASEIPSGTYPFQPEAVSTIAVKAVLMTFDFTPEKSDYHAESCKATADLSHLLLENLERLRATGHARNAGRMSTSRPLPPGWKGERLREEGMAAEYAFTCGPRAKPRQDETAAAPQSANADPEYLRLLKQRLGTQ